MPNDYTMSQQPQQPAAKQKKSRKGLKFVALALALQREQKKMRAEPWKQDEKPSGRMTTRELSQVLRQYFLKGGIVND